MSSPSAGRWKQMAGDGVGSALASRWRQMKRWPGWVVLAIAVVGLLVVGATRESGPQSSEERVEEIAKRLACPICDGESVFESRNNASAALRNRVTVEVTAGLLTDDEIITSIEQLYGAKVLLVPKATGLDALIWALPVAALVCAVAGLAVTFRRWRRQATSNATEADRVLVREALAGDRDEP